MPPLSLKSVIPAVLADWYQIYLSEYVAPQGWLTSPNSCLAPRKSPAGILSTPSRVFISINTGVCTREGTRLLGSLISRCMLLTDQKTLQTNKKTSSSKTPGLFVGLAREGNRGSRWFTKKLWPLWWPSIKKFYFLLNKNKLQGGDNICIKHNRQKSNFKTLHRMIKKNSKSPKIKWAKRIRGENIPQRNYKHKKNVQRSL